MRLSRQQQLILGRICSIVPIGVCREVDRMLFVCGGGSGGCERNGGRLLRRLHATVRHRHDGPGHRSEGTMCCDGRAQSAAAMDARSRQRRAATGGAEAKPESKERRATGRVVRGRETGGSNQANAGKQMTIVHDECTALAAWGERKTEPTARSHAAQAPLKFIKHNPSSSDTSTTSISKGALQGATAVYAERRHDRTMREEIQQCRSRVAARRLTEIQRRASENRIRNRAP